MKIAEMTGFPTCGKKPKVSWRNEENRWNVGAVLENHGQVGIVPAEHGFVVLDLDCKNNVNGKDNLFKKFKNLPRSMNYRTQSGGFHLWYKVPEGTEIPQSTSKIPGVDIRYSDGYVCISSDYEIRDEETQEDCPQPLLDWLMKKPRDFVGRARSSDYEPAKQCGGGRRRTYDLSPIPKGQRNDKMFRWGCGLRRSVANGEISSADFEDLIYLRGKNSGLSPFECDLILDSILRTAQ